MVISEVCNSSWNWCCSKGQMDLIKYFHFKTLEFFYLAFSNWLFLIKKKKIPFQENFWYFSFQPRWNERCKQNGLMLDGHLVWETALLITCQKTKRLPPCKKGVIQFAFGHQQKPLFFFFSYMEPGWFPQRPREGGVDCSWEYLKQESRVKKQEYKQQQLSWSITQAQPKHSCTYCTNFLLLTTH